MTHLGDVIEFGADAGHAIDSWYGYVQSADETNLQMVGPFAEASQATDDAHASLVRWRIDQVVSAEGEPEVSDAT